MRARFFFVLALLPTIAISARTALGADAATEDARRHFLKGQQFFDVGRWDDAAAEFEQAYAARNDPTFIYNMAQAFRRKGDAKRALELYKNYLIKAPNSPQRPEVEERIEALQQQVEEADRAAKATTPAPQPVPQPTPAPASLPPTFPTQGYAPAPAPSPGSASAPAPTAVSPSGPTYAPDTAATPAPGYVTAPASTPPSGASPGKGLRVGGIVCGATGVALIGAGIFFGVEAQEYSHTVESGPVFNPNFDDRGKLYAKLQWVGYGVGGSLLVTGAVLYGFGLRAAKSPTVAFVPAVFPGGVGFGARGTY